jgi:hypothetical protein
MDPSAPATPTSLPVSQRELLALIMGCAARTSATFNQAEFTLIAASAGPNVRTLTRELLNDLAIRGWIELRRRLPEGEKEVERVDWAVEFAAERNWDGATPDCVRYALTEAGRERLWGRAGR